MTRTVSPLAAALLVLTACAQQTPPPPPPDPPRPAAKRLLPTPPRPQPQGEAARSERGTREREAQASCAYRASLVEDRFQDQGQSPLGLDGTLAGQSARDACLRSYQQTGRVPEVAP